MPETDRAQVRFYSKSCYRKFKSEQEGRPIYEPVDYVEIGTLGDDKQIVDQAVKPGDMTRFPREWEAYQRGQNMETDGTPLTEGPRSADADTEALKTAEDVEPKGALSDCQRRSKSSPPGRSKTSPLNVMQHPALRGVPVVHRRAPRCFV